MVTISNPVCYSLQQNMYIANQITSVTNIANQITSVTDIANRIAMIPNIYTDCSDSLTMSDEDLEALRRSVSSETIIEHKIFKIHINM